MIKRKKYKRNPELTKLFYYHLAIAIVYGDPTDLAYAKMIYKQGEFCNDCNQQYLQCNCEECPNCEFQRCLCELGFTINEWLDSNASDKIIKKYRNITKKAAKKYAKIVLNKEQLEELNEYIQKKK